MKDILILSHYSKSSFEHGRPYAYDRKMVCPNCSKFEGYPGTCTKPGVITSPVFMVVKINKATKKNFLGCPNFPSCKCSADVYSERVAKKKAQIWNFDYDDELRLF